MVARYVRDVEVPGSNPGSPTRHNKEAGTFWGTGLFLFNPERGSYFQRALDTICALSTLQRNLLQAESAWTQPSRLQSVPAITFSRTTRLTSRSLGLFAGPSFLPQRVRDFP